MGVRCLVWASCARSLPGKALLWPLSRESRASSRGERLRFKASSSEAPPCRSLSPSLRADDRHGLLEISLEIRSAVSLRARARVRLCSLSHLSTRLPRPRRLGATLTRSRRTNTCATAQRELGAWFGTTGGVNSNEVEIVSIAECDPKVSGDRRVTLRFPRS